MHIYCQAIYIYRCIIVGNHMHAHACIRPDTMIYSSWSRTIYLHASWHMDPPSVKHYSCGHNITILIYIKVVGHLCDCMSKITRIYNNSKQIMYSRAFLTWNLKPCDSRIYKKRNTITHSSVPLALNTRFLSLPIFFVSGLSSSSLTPAGLEGARGGRLARP